jgi:hypothetical protein
MSGPFSRIRDNFQSNYFSEPPLQRASIATDPSDQKRLTERERTQDTPVAFPQHLFAPSGAQTIDMRRMCSVSPLPGFQLFMEFNPSALGLKGGAYRFTHYAVACDGELEVNYEFLPTMNEARIFPYHGDPQNRFKISLGLAPDLSDNALIAAELYMRSTDVLRWYVKNNDTVAADMGVRMKGYLDTTQRTVSARFGG